MDMAVGSQPSGTRPISIAGARLPAAQERALLHTVRHDADEAARQRARSELWQAHRGLVAAVASRFRRTGTEMADLIGAGQLGLHAAIVRFDPDRFPGRLSTYAVPWIRWYVQDHINRNTGPVRLPSTTAHRQLARFGGRLFEDARKACHRELVPATEMELCARVGLRLGLSADEVAHTQYAINSAGGASDAAPALDTLAEDTTPEEAMIRRLDHEKLRRRVLALAETILGERERTVFLARCMTGERPIVQLDALALQFGVSRERIYQLEGSARRKIVVALGNEGLSELPKPMPSRPPSPQRLAV